ncbi:efflux RND transporter permease subunit [Pedobacter sp. ASV12]|nr:efflux RND transporter permease subunit [Pedobacter sp. ASV12]
MCIRDRGILGLITLPVSQYPEIAPPTVQVSASYQGVFLTF